MEFGISFPSSLDAPGQAALAEDLGFSHVGFYDTPALEPDVWITIANAVQATRRIQVGTQVLIPSLRHPIAQAAAISTVEQLAPGRLFLGVGTGFTGRMAMGQRPLTWASMRRFLSEMRALLAGEQIEIDGATTQLLHHKPDFGSATPIRVPWLVAANGPKGIAVARELGDGLIYGGPHEHVPAGFRTLQMSAGNAIILKKGETASSPRVLKAAQIPFATQYHVVYEGTSSSAVERLPYGSEWLAALQRHPAEIRHLIVHDLHCVGVTSHDEAFIERHPDTLAEFASQIAITPAMLRERVDAIAALGATRISFASYMEADWTSVLHAYADAVGLQQPS